MPISLTASAAGQAEVPKVSRTPTKVVNLHAAGCELFSAERIRLWCLLAAMHCLLLSSGLCMNPLPKLRSIVLKALTCCAVAKHLPQKQANAYSSLAASAQTPPEEQARLLAAISCHQDKHRHMTQSSIRSKSTWACMHSNTHIVMVFCLSACRSAGSSLLLGYATHNIVYPQQHDCTLN